MSSAVARLLVSIRRIVSSHVFAARVRIALAGPVVSFTFDDVPASAFAHGVPILDACGCKATFYVSGRLCEPGSGFLTREQVRALHDGRHEIGGHTFGHIQTGRCRRSVLRDDLRRSEAFFRGVCAGARPVSFSYPNGSVGLWNKPLLAGRYESCRSTCPGLNCGTIDLHTLRAEKLYSGRMTAQCVDELVAAAAAERAWLIFYTHDVGPRPSAVGCRPELLEHAVRAALDVGAEVLTVRDAVARLRGPGETPGA